MFHAPFVMEFPVRTVKRIEEALREIAVLFIALAALDVFLGEDPERALGNGLAFVVLGLFLFALAVYIERRRCGES
jgi:hypothetical protein